ncbi:MAG: tungstate ABC transporter ATP-binding protein WtpC [Candidatus Baldrarchaeia archaeon]
MLEVIDLWKKWNEFELQGISFKVDSGEYFVLLGPSGAGKTLLLECIAGLHVLDKGKIIVDGEDVTFLPPEKRSIGMVFQEYALFPHMTVWENVEFGLEVRKVPINERRKMVKELLELLRVEKLAHRYPVTLSGGEKQRVALARALAVNPKVLLLDEPLSALDAPLRRKLRDELRRLHKILKIPFVHVTHDQMEAFSLADKIAVINKGVILEVGSPEKVFTSPRDTFVAEFVGFENIFKGKARREGNLTVIDIGGVKIRASEPAEGDVIVAIRPEEIVLSLRPVETSAQNVIEGKVVEVVQEAFIVKLRVDVGNVQFTVYITRKSFLEMKIDIGCKVSLIFKASSVKIL